MCDEWMPTIELPLTLEQFRQLPRNPAYKYEYLNGKACLTPRSRHYHAILDLSPRPHSDEVDVRPVKAGELEKLVPLFAATFRSIQPYGSLDDETRLKAARHAMERTRTGGDGPLIEQASFIALEKSPSTEETAGDLIGAILITLLPNGDPCEWDSYRWEEPPPSDCIERRLGRPHLTWVFVAHHLAGRGVGTALLAASVNALGNMGFQQLLTTFMVGNDSSMLWHWRNGFQLLSHPGSRRLRDERWKGLKSEW
jgi:GNAT superfamily N-acetyltransferase